jgi:phosphohistidine phosphatase
LLGLIRGISGDADNALIIGHNPGLERLVVELTHDDKHGLREKAVKKFPTAAVAVIELPVDDWADVEPGSGKLVELIVPKELD